MLALQGAAIAASLLHVLVDVYIDLFGTGLSIDSAAMLALVMYALVYGWWGVLLGLASRADVLRALAIMSFSWVAVGNGTSILFCPPPCAGAAPLGDISHVASLVFGVSAGIAAWRARRTASGPDGWAVAVLTLAIVVIALAALAVSATPPPGLPGAPPA